MGVEKDELPNIETFICNACAANPLCPFDEPVMKKCALMMSWKPAKVIAWIAEFNLRPKFFKVSPCVIAADHALLFTF
jgi:hypothetical protein